MEKQCFTQFSARIYLNRSLTASDFFHMFTWSMKLYTFYCHMLKSADDEKGHSSKVQKINGCSCSSFYSKTCTFWILGGGVSKKGGVDSFQGKPEDFLKVIFNC